MKILYKYTADKRVGTRQRWWGEDEAGKIINIWRSFYCTYKRDSYKSNVCCFREHEDVDVFLFCVIEFLPESSLGLIWCFWCRGDRPDSSTESNHFSWLSKLISRIVELSCILMSNVGTNKRTLLHIPSTHTHTQSPSWCSIMYSVLWTLLSHLNCLLQEFAHKINPQFIVSCHIQGCTFCLSIWLKRQNGSHNAPDTHCTRLVGRNLIIAHLRDEVCSLCVTEFTLDLTFLPSYSWR